MIGEYENDVMESTEMGTDAPAIDTEALAIELEGREDGPADDREDNEFANLLARHPGAQKYYHPTGKPPLLEIMESWVVVHDAALATLDLIYHNATDGIDDSSERAHIALYGLRHAMREQLRDIDDIIGLAYELNRREIVQ